MKIRILLTVINLLLCFAGFAQTFEWAKSEAYPSFATWSNKVVHDNFGNTFISSQHDNGVMICKYDNSGAKSWLKNYIGYGDITSLCTDNSGNLYCVIMMGGVTIDGVAYLANTSTGGYLFVKHDPAGNVVWVKRVKPSMRLSDKTDSQDNIIVSGGFGTFTNLGNGFSLTPSSNFRENFFLAKYNTNGECIWAIQKDGSKYSPLKFDQNNMYVCDYFYDSITLGKGSKQITFFENQGQSYIAKYKPNGDLDWAKQGESYFIAPDNLGNLYSLQKDFDHDNTNILVKYDSLGNEIWKRTRYTCGTGYKFGMNCNADGDLYISGGYSGTLSVGDSIRTASDMSVFIAKINSEGIVKWLNTSSGSGWSGTKDLAVKGNEIYVTGDMGGSNLFGDNSIDETDGGVFVIKMIDHDASTSAIKDSSQPSSEFNVYPNPSTNVINVTYSSNNNISALKLEIKNIIGQVIYSTDTSSINSEFKKSIDLSTQNKGTYFIEINADNKREVKRIILN